MTRLARASIVATSLLSLTASLLIACGGDDAVTASPVVSDAGAPDGASDPGDALGDALGDASTGDALQPDAAADAKADVGDQMAFDTFSVGDQGAVVTTGMIQGVASTGIRIAQGAGGYFCGGTGVAGHPSIELTVATTAASLTPGTYPITNGAGTTTRSEATFQLVDKQCQSLASHAAQSGSITITSMDATSVTGKYDITFAGFVPSGRAVGGFVAPICNVALWGPKANCQP